MPLNYWALNDVKAQAAELGRETSNSLKEISANWVTFNESMREVKEKAKNLDKSTWKVNGKAKNLDKSTWNEDSSVSVPVENQEKSASEVEKRIDELNNKLPLSYLHYEGTNANWDALNREWKMTSENWVIKTESVLLVGLDKTPEPGSQTIYELFKIQGGSYMLHQKGKTKDGTLIDKTEQKTSEDVQENVLPVFYNRVNTINTWQEEDNKKNQQIIEQQKAQQKADDQMFWYNPDQDQGTLFW